MLPLCMSFLHYIRKISPRNGSNISLMPKVEVSSISSCASVSEALLLLLHLRLSLVNSHLILYRE